MNKKFVNTIVVLMVPVILFLFFLVLRPAAFGKLNTIIIIITQSFSTCIIAWGMQYLAKMGEFDMSLGAEIVLDGIVAALLCEKIGILGIIIGCMLVATVCGLVKGLLYRIMGIPVMIMTIALVYLMGAVGGLITNSEALTIAYEYTVLGYAPGNVIMFIIAAILMYIIANKSVYGAHVKAVAGSAHISKNNGISVQKIKIRSLFVSSMFAGIAAIVWLSHGSGVTPTVGLDSISNIMQPLMSVYIGFVMAQYINIVPAIFVASILMAIISNGITALNWSSAIYNVVVGAVLTLIMSYMSIADIYSRKKAERNGAITNMKNFGVQKTV